MTLHSRRVVTFVVIVVAVVLALVSSIFTGNQLSDPNMLDATQPAAASS